MGSTFTPREAKRTSLRLSRYRCCIAEWGREASLRNLGGAPCSRPPLGAPWASLPASSSGLLRLLLPGAWSEESALKASVAMKRVFVLATWEQVVFSHRLHLLGAGQRDLGVVFVLRQRRP